MQCIIWKCQVKQHHLDRNQQKECWPASERINSVILIRSELRFQLHPNSNIRLCQCWVATVLQNARALRIDEVTYSLSKSKLVQISCRRMYDRLVTTLVLWIQILLLTCRESVQRRTQLSNFRSNSTPRWLSLGDIWLRLVKTSCFLTCQVVQTSTVITIKSKHLNLHSLSEQMLSMA